MMKIVQIGFAALALLSFTGAAYAEGDVEKGKKVFRKCKACHMVGPKAKKKVGPVLTGIVGKKAGAAEKFKYSKLLKGAAEKGLVWDEAMLDKYLDKKGMNKTLKAFITEKGGEPKGKSKMAFAGLKKADDRANVIAYLKSFAAE